MSEPVIILTGGSRGLGLAILQILLSRHKARVLTISRTSSPQLEELVSEYGSDRVECVQGDIGEVKVNAGLVKRVLEKWKRLDGLVLNAGNMNISRISDLSLTTLPTYITTNLSSLLYLLQPSLPHIRKTKGRIVFVSSGASTRGYQAWGMYSVVKAGMNSLCRTLAAEEEGLGVGCWAVRPGLVDTSMQAFLRETGSSQMHPTEFEKFTSAHEGGKLLSPDLPGEVIAGLVVAGSGEFSGEYLDWEDERLARFRSASR